MKALRAIQRIAAIILDLSLAAFLIWFILNWENIVTAIRTL